MQLIWLHLMPEDSFHRGAVKIEYVVGLPYMCGNSHTNTLTHAYNQALSTRRGAFLTEPNRTSHPYRSFSTLWMEENPTTRKREKEWVCPFVSTTSVRMYVSRYMGSGDFHVSAKPWQENDECQYFALLFIHVCPSMQGCVWMWVCACVCVNLALYKDMCMAFLSCLFIVFCLLTTIVTVPVSLCICACMHVCVCVCGSVSVYVAFILVSWFPLPLVALMSCGQWKFSVVSQCISVRS